jgi:hypothetical protein
MDALFMHAQGDLRVADIDTPRPPTDRDAARAFALPADRRPEMNVLLNFD